MNRKLILSFFSILILSFYACQDDEIQLDKTAILTSTSWLGGVEWEIFNYDIDNQLIEHSISQQDEGPFRLYQLHSDKSAVIYYDCNEEECSGTKYAGKWEVSNNVLQILINREELGSMTDAIEIEAEIFKISSTELILEFVTNVPPASTPMTPSQIVKIISRVKYISSTP